MPSEDPTLDTYFVPTDYSPSGEPSSLPYPFPSDLSTEEPTLVTDSEPNYYSPSGDPSSFLSSLSSNLPLYESTLSPPYAPRESPSGYL